MANLDDSKPEPAAPVAGEIVAPTVQAETPAPQAEDDPGNARAAAMAADATSASSAAADGDSGGTGATDVRLRNHAFLAAILFVAALGASLLAYLAVSVPASWFPTASPQAWAARSLTVARGSGAIEGDELVITALDASGVALITVNSDLRAVDYPVIEWIAIDVPDGGDVRLLWRTDYQPSKLNSAPVGVAAGSTLPVLLAKNKAWIGRVAGLALVIRGPLNRPIRMRGVVAKPMGAPEMIRDRAAEWLAIRGWATAYNNVIVGADRQDLPLLPLLAAAVAIAGALLLLLRRFWTGLPPHATAGALLSLFVAAWFVLDARWTWNLGSQVKTTARALSGKDFRAKRLAAEDGPLFAFVEKARGAMPPIPARVFVVAASPYLRGRAAYLMYPHSAYTDQSRDRVPPASAMRPGDWLLIYRRAGFEYDGTTGTLHWDGAQSVAAEPKLVEQDAALFRIR